MYLEHLSILVDSKDGETKKVKKELLPSSCFGSISLCEDYDCSGLPEGKNIESSFGSIFL